MNYGSSTSSWNPGRWVRLNWLLPMRDIYINFNWNPLTKFTSSSRTTVFKDILPWNISQMIAKTVSISSRLVISNAMKRGIPLWIWWKFNENWDNNMIRISQLGKAIVEQILASEERNTCKEQECEYHSLGSLKKINHLSKVAWDRKIITEFTRNISSTKIDKPVLMMDVKVSKDKHISRWVNRENLIYVNEIESKTVHKDEEGDR